MSFSELLAFTPGSFYALKENPYIIPHLKAFPRWLKILGWAGVCQYSKLLKCSIENQHFATQNGKQMYAVARDCISKSVKTVCVIKNVFYSTGYPRSKWTKLNCYFRQKTCINF